MSSNLQPLRRQRRGDETRRRLIDATKRLLAEFDFQTVTLDQISSSVGVAKSSILWHFGSKEALLTEAVFDLFEEIDSKLMLEKSNLETAEERVRYLFTAVAEYFMANPSAKGIIIALIFNQQVNGEIKARINEQWEQHIAEIQEFLSGDDQTISHDCAAAMLALMHGAYMQWFLRGCPDGFANELPAMTEAMCGELVAMAASGDSKG
jgi:AcrR family transcriptional regulator